MEQQISTIKSWLGTGSINVFGLPMSGKDTQGIHLAEVLNARFISSGMIIRAKEAETDQNLTASGELLPTNLFYEWVLPYLKRDDLAKSPLVLSSIGRWKGEENSILSTCEEAGHPIKAVILLNISETDVKTRFDASKTLQDRGERQDDKDLETFERRIQEFINKTMPVIAHYRELGLLVNVNGDQTRDAVFAEIISKLAQLAERASANAKAHNEIKSKLRPQF